jgi:hypothetical protein
MNRIVDSRKHGLLGVRPGTVDKDLTRFRAGIVLKVSAALADVPGTWHASFCGVERCRGLPGRLRRAIP